MRDFSKSLRVGNFEDKEKAKYFIKVWERRLSDAKRFKSSSEQKLKDLFKAHGSYGGRDVNKKQIEAEKKAINEYDAQIQQYTALIRQASKSF